VVSSQIVLGLQTITSRQVDLTKVPAIITVGRIQGGNRGNIIPDSVIMEGTVRTFDEAMRADIKERIKRTAEQIAGSAGATIRGAGSRAPPPPTSRRLNRSVVHAGALQALCRRQTLCYPQAHAAPRSTQHEQ